VTASPPDGGIVGAPGERDGAGAKGGGSRDERGGEPKAAWPGRQSHLDNRAVGDTRGRGVIMSS
jgi:hypothetical protein